MNKGEKKKTSAYAHPTGHNFYIILLFYLYEAEYESLSGLIP